jgi:hypothetical protein
LADATVVDAQEACTSFPHPGDPLCVIARPFCCPYSLETPSYCSASSTSTTGFECREQPIDGILQQCDSTSGAGCPTDHAICCSEQLSNDTFTYCSDHAYQGPGWTCSHS